MAAEFFFSPLQPSVLALGWALLHAVWQAALIAAGYAALRLVFRRARARVALGHLALLALILAPLSTFLGRVANGTSAAMAQDGLLVVSALAAADAGGFALEALLPWLVIGWSGGVLLLCLRQAVQWRELHRLCRRAEPLAGEWPLRFAALQARVGVRFRVGLRQSTQVALPMLVGILRPTILMPAGLMLRLPADRLELILLHELAHLRRLDPFFNLLQTVVETLLFFHPAVHWLSRRLREDRELCCDEIVLANGADPLRYARVLLTLAETQGAPAPTLALAATGGVLMHRIERIVDLPGAGQSAPRAIGPVGVMLAVALLGTVLLQGQGRWATLEPLPWGFGHVRLATSADEWQPQVSDLVPRLGVALGPVTALESAAQPEPTFAAMPPPARPALALPTRLAPAVAMAPVVVERATVTAPPLPPAAAAAGDGPQPVQRRAPIYPPLARKRGLEGVVMLTYRIDLDGRPFDIVVDGAQAEGEFERAAREALQQWRFDAASASMDAQRVRFDFRLDGEAQPVDTTHAADTRRCMRVTGSRLCRPGRDGAVRTLVMTGS